MDTLDRALLTALQSEFPLEVRPFDALAKKLGTSERDIIDRVTALKQEGIVRQISAIFDSGSIGYRSTLIAFSVPEEADQRAESKRIPTLVSTIERVAASISAHEGVSHNYQRVGHYNLWFTLTLPKRKSTEKEAARLARVNGIHDWLFLPAIRTFKIRFQLDMSKTGRTATRPVEPIRPAPTRKPVRVPPAFIRELQKDLPVVSRPFLPAARALGVSEETIIARIRRYTESGAIRRIAAVLRQKKAGFTANVMVAWAPKPAHLERLAACAVSQQRVSHCYERPTSAKWPYSLYTMIHGRSMKECEAVIEEIARKARVSRHALLPTVKEFKKVRVSYFTS